MLNSKLLKNEEKAIYALRQLYSGYGYSQFKMSKFEEYDFYVRNMHSLISNGIITFTDTTGKLMALKPDVTLSIIKNSKDIEGFVTKLYYDESVYRISGGSGSYKEITQTGLECIGDIGVYEVCEVVSLAIKSLNIIDGEYMLDISHAGMIAALFEACDMSSDIQKRALEYIRAKNIDGIVSLYDSGLISENSREVCVNLTRTYKGYKEVVAAFSKLAQNPEVMESMNEFGAVMYALNQAGLTDKINIDFSIVGNMKYYSGIIFKGYINGIPQAVLSGGQYDKLAAKMGKNSGAIGFAVYLDMLERYGNETGEYDADIVIIKNDAVSSAELLSAVEKLSEEGNRVIVLGKVPKNYRYKKLIMAEELRGE